MMPIDLLVAQNKKMIFFEAIVRVSFCDGDLKWQQ